MDDPRRTRVDPRSPVQPPSNSPAPYFAAAVLGALIIWTVQQRWIEDDGVASSDRESTAIQTVHRSPEPRRANLRTLFSADDYPAEAMRNGEQGTVQAELTIDTRGRVKACNIVRSSGYASLDEATCSIMRRRARFRPLHDANGKAVEDHVRTPPVVWRLMD